MELSRIIINNNSRPLKPLQSTNSLNSTIRSLLRSIKRPTNSEESHSTTAQDCHDVVPCDDVPPCQSPIRIDDEHNLAQSHTSVPEPSTSPPPQLTLESPMRIDDPDDLAPSNTSGRQPSTSPPPQLTCQSPIGIDDQDDLAPSHTSFQQLSISPLDQLTTVPPQLTSVVSKSKVRALPVKKSAAKSFEPKQKPLTIDDQIEMLQKDHYVVTAVGGDVLLEDLYWSIMDEYEGRWKDQQTTTPVPKKVRRIDTIPQNDQDSAELSDASTVNVSPTSRRGSGRRHPKVKGKGSRHS